MNPLNANCMRRVGVMAHEWRMISKSPTQVRQEHRGKRFIERKAALKRKSSCSNLPSNRSVLPDFACDKISTNQREGVGSRAKDELRPPQTTGVSVGITPDSRWELIGQKRLTRLEEQASSSGRDLQAGWRVGRQFPKLRVRKGSVPAARRQPRLAAGGRARVAGGHLAAEVLACRPGPEVHLLLSGKEGDVDGATLKCLLRELGRAGAGQASIEVLHWALAGGVALEPIHFNTAIMACGRCGMWREAEEVFAAMVAGREDGDARIARPNVFTYNILISALTNNRQHQAALDVFAGMRAAGVGADLVTFSTVVKACAQMGEWERAVRLLPAMAEAGVQPDLVIYNMLLSACDQAGQLRPALRVLQEMKDTGTPPDTATYTTLVSACHRSGQPQRALEFVQEMHAVGLEVPLFLYSTLVTAFGRAGRWRGAGRVVSTMRSHGVQPTSLIFSTLIGVYHRAGQWKLAMSTYSEMLDAGLQPNTIMFSSLISACEKGGQWETALSVFDQMKVMGVEPDTITFSAAIKACETGGDREQALHLLQEMKSLGVEPNVVTYNALMLACRDEWDRVLEIFREMLERSIVPTAYTFSALISACERAGRLEDAVSLLGIMQKMGVDPNPFIYNALISACEKACQLDQALEVFEHMKISKVEPDGITFGALISACLAAGEWQRGLHLLQHMRLRQLVPDEATYNPLLNVLWNSGNRRLAVQVYEQALVDNAYAPRVSPAESVQDLHNMSAGAAHSKLVLWLLSLKVCVESREIDRHYQDRDNECPASYTIITGWGKHSKHIGNSEVKDSITKWLADMNAPFRVSLKNQGRLVAISIELYIWLKQIKEEDLIGPSGRSMFDLSD